MENILTIDSDFKKLRKAERDYLFITCLRLFDICLLYLYLVLTHFDGFTYEALFPSDCTPQIVCLGYLAVGVVMRHSTTSFVIVDKNSVLV